MPKQELERLQQRFKKAVTTPGARQSPAWLEIKDSAPIPYERRLEIYQYAYFARIHESLCEDFPRLVALLGEKKFEQLCKEYLAKYPSRYASLAEVGRRLSLYLKETEPWKRKSQLSDLAGFEWELFVASMVANPKLATLGPKMAATVANFFFLHPTVRVFHSAWEVDRATSTKVPRSKKKLFWVVFRQNGKVKCIRIAQNQFVVLERLFNGHALESLVETFEKLKISQKQASHWFKRWTQNGIITGFQNA